MVAAADSAIASITTAANGVAPAILAVIAILVTLGVMAKLIKKAR